MEIMNPDQQCLPGMILQSSKNMNSDNSPPHKIVYLSPHKSGHYFLGAMLTSSTSLKFSNVPINEDFFLKKWEDLEFDYPTKETLVRPRFLLKPMEWSPFNLVGKLTEEGLKIVLEAVDDTEPIVYEKNIDLEEICNQ